jgi:hypothetical protein
VGENRNDDEKDERARTGEPQERLGRDAWLRGRHRFTHLAWSTGIRQVRHKRTTSLTARPRPRRLVAVTRAPELSIVFIKAARFHVR